MTDHARPHLDESDARFGGVFNFGKEMAMAYATILLKEGSNYNQIHNEEVFFEAL